MSLEEIEVGDDDEGRMGYERFVRRAHRYSVAGANANIYDEYKGVLARYYGRGVSQEDQNPERTFEVGLKMGEIAAYLRTALYLVRDQYRQEMDEEQRSKLDECEKLVNEPNEENIDALIREGNRLFKSLDLY